MFLKTSDPRRPIPTAVVTFVWLALAPVPSPAQDPPRDLGSISLEALSNTEITSVSRKDEKLSQTAAAAYVITQEDIRRSGATSIPEMLRMVPGLDVARIDANKWAVTARGFNERFSDKILVMIDGRTVLTPLSSGVNWDAQDTFLEDIERIEVIRGPGASLWGANAVNGVINVITKKAKDTQGGLVTAGGGSEDRGSGGARYGGTMGDRGHYRIYSKYFNRAAFTGPSGRPAADDWREVRGGFRADWDLSRATDLTVQGDLFQGNTGTTVTGLLSLTPQADGSFFGTFNDRAKLSGGNILARWHRLTGDKLDTTVQMYVERDHRNETGILGELRHTADVEFEQHYTPGNRHDLVWGGDYRFTNDKTAGSLNISFVPDDRTTNLYGAYLQDDITLVEDRLRVTLGAKLEHNSFSGFAIQPNSRLFWTPAPRYTLWLGASRASESSSRIDADVRKSSDAFLGADGVTTLVSGFGTDGLPPDDVVSYELGQRTKVRNWLAVDVATYYNHYTNRHTHEPGAPYWENDPGPPHWVLPTYTASNTQGETHGVEVATTFQVASHWKVRTGYTFFQIHLHPKPASPDQQTAKDEEGSSPHHQFQVRAQLDLAHHLEFDLAAYYVSKLAGPQVPSYTRADARLGWRPMKPLELSLGVENLLDPRHFEFGSGDLADATQVGRNAYGKLTWRF